MLDFHPWSTNSIL